MRKGTNMIKFIKHSLDKTCLKKLITMTAIDERTYAFMHALPFFNNISPVSQSESESEMFLFDHHKKFIQTCCLSNAPLVARLVGASPFNIVFSLSDCKSEKTVMTQISTIACNFATIQYNQRQSHQNPEKSLLIGAPKRWD